MVINNYSLIMLYHFSLITSSDLSFIKLFLIKMTRHSRFVMSFFDLNRHPSQHLTNHPHKRRLFQIAG